MNINSQRPTQSFVFASWAALCLGIGAYLIGLWNADMDLSDRGYQLTLVFYGLFSVISLQKAVRDRYEGIPVTDIYYGLSWASTLIAIMLLAIGLMNANLALSEKGFYAMAYALSIFGAIAVGKNTRDIAAYGREQAGRELAGQESPPRRRVKQAVEEELFKQPEGKNGDRQVTIPSRLA